MAGYVSTDPDNSVLLHVTTLLNCAAGIVGSTVGAAKDTALFGVYVQANSPAVTVTIGGLFDTNGNPHNLLISGSATADYSWTPPAPVLNSKAAFTFTASVADKVSVLTRAYIGP